VLLPLLSLVDARLLAPVALVRLATSRNGKVTGKLSSREKREDGEQDEQGESVVCLTVVALLSLLGLVDAVLPAPVALVRLATSRNGKERATHEHSWDSSCEQCKRCVRLVGVM
jgi:hypothetical protein